MAPTVPEKLKSGDTVRIIAPSRSLSIIGERVRQTAEQRFAELGLRLSYGEHVAEREAFGSSPVESRLSDLHAAFADAGVAGILTVIGGFNSNQLLPWIDWDLIRANPKVLCGYSDITALQNAILARSDLVTYSGPHWSTFGMEHHFEPTLEAFVDCLFRSEPFDLRPSEQWSDDEWYLDQQDRRLERNEGWWLLANGRASGRLVGGNLCTLNLLQRAQYMPPLEGAVLFLEDDCESKPHHFDRHLTSLLQQPDAEGVRGLLIGRFQRQSRMTRELLEQIVRTKSRLDGLPVIANLDFGHTDPVITLPVGGEVEIDADPKSGQAMIRVGRH
jgi:muramoyltetrapeptide carboxypeptidase